MRARLLPVTVAAVLLIAAVPAAAQADAGRPPPDEDRFINAALPDVTLTTAAGDTMTLAAAGRGKPVILTFVFTRCTGVCSPFLRSWRAADRSAGGHSDFRRLVLSFDPRDSAADMAALAQHLNAEGDSDWTFAVASPGDIQALTAAVGFWYDWDAARQQFDHPAMLAGIRGGRLVRLLVGGSVGSGRLNELVRDVLGEFVPSYPLPGRVPFRCVQYDATTGRTTLDWGFALLLVPVSVTGITTLALFSAGARSRRLARDAGVVAAATVVRSVRL